jgi:hypothetical protein
MDWKQFIKPDIRKVIAFLLLMNFLGVIISCMIIMGSCNILMIFLGWMFIIILFTNPMFTIPILLVIYVFSCLIVWTYEKLGKSKGIIFITIISVIILSLDLYILIPGYSYESRDNVQYRSALRDCCVDRTIYNCDTNTIDNVNCEVSWDANLVPMNLLMNNSGIDIDNINAFCFCI